MTRQFMKTPTKRSLALVSLLLAAAAAVSWPAYAHHSFAVYDRSKVLTLKGNGQDLPMDQSSLRRLGARAAGGGGDPQEWSFETTSPGVLTRGGWTRNSIKAGDRVSVEYYPLRDGSHGGGLNAVTLLDTGQKLSASFAASEKPASIARTTGLHGNSPDSQTKRFGPQQRDYSRSFSR